MARPLVLIGPVGFLALLLAACDAGGGPDPTPTSRPTPTAAASPAVPGRTDTPVPPVEPTDYRFLYSEFGRGKDVIWTIDPDKPSDRGKVAEVRHKQGFAINAVLSPDGTRIAYNVLPPDGASADTDAETRILELQTKETELVARGVDLQTAPVWAADGGLLFVRRNLQHNVTVALVQLFEREDLATPTPTPSDDGLPPTRTVLRQSVSRVLSYVPLDVDPEDATLLFAQVQGGTESGTFLGRYAPATGEAVATATAVAEATATATAATATAIAEATATAGAATATAKAATATPRPTPTPVGTPTSTPSPTPTPTPAPLPGDVFLTLSDQIIRSFSLSEDRSKLAFPVPGLVEGEFVARTHVVDLEGETVSPLPLPEGVSAGDHLNPIFQPSGGRVSFGQLPSGPNPGRVAVVSLGEEKVSFLRPPERGFDEPVSWSPDGRFLAVRWFPGESLGNPGEPRLVFVSRKGQRLPAPEGAAITPVGWIKRG